jgi:O-antigen/teichoic acid export membrane protein
MVKNSIRTVIGNVVFVLTSDVVNRATTFFLYALVARYLGVLAFGQLSLAFTLFATSQVFAVMGLKTFVTREVAKDTSKTGSYLVNGSLVVIVSSVLSFAFMALFVRLMGYSADTSSIILLLSAALLPFSLAAICEAVFQAHEQMRYIAFANVPVNIIKVSMAFLILHLGYGLHQLVLLLLAAYAMVVALEWFLMLHHVIRPRLDVSPRFALTMCRSTSTFLGIDGILAIVGSLYVVLLSKLVGEAEAGLYNAATQLMVPMTLIYQSVVSSVFPIMCRRFEPGFQSLKRIAEYLIELLLTVALPTLVGLFFLAEAALLLLYGRREFLPASGTLRIIVWNLILIALTNVLGPVLVASMREKVTLRIVAINGLVSLVLGLILISQFGLLGAAITAVASRSIDFVQHYVPVSRLFSRLSLGRLAWKPLVASGCMAVYLALVGDSQGILITVVSAGLLYAAVLTGLTIWSIGGPRQLKTRYQYLWSE